MYVLYIMYIGTLGTLGTQGTSSCDFAYHSSSHGLIGSIVARATFTNSLSSALSSCDT